MDVYDSAIIEFNLGNFKKALVLFEQVLQSEPLHVTALIKKGNILGKFAKYSDAISCYDKALSVEPKNALALINKGLALHYLQKYPEAITCYDAILEEKPKSALTLYNKASSLVRDKQIPEGLEILKKAIVLDFSCKYKARSDVDFEQIQKTPEFKRLVL
ncbi:MAG: tetratricopeptide repeat protein [Thaumarchaeota archaeon]|nr:tetratricopeptide repeat protein [Nitrososphaerota archaeon]